MVSTRNKRQTENPGEGFEELPLKAPKLNSRRKKRNEELKSKATGVGLKISTDSASTKVNKKIVFEDELTSDKEEEETPTSQEEAPTENEKNDEGDDADDDGAIEEVQGRKAREEILEQLQDEEKFSIKSKKKRRKKERKEAEAKEEEEEDFDDDFFAQLESAKAEEKKKLESSRPKGKHTSFVFSQEDESNLNERPKKVGHNIQVVVLRNPEDTSSTTTSAITSVPITKLSQEALIFSRSHLVGGSDGVARGATGKKRKWQPDNTWRRSKKMNNLVRVRRGRAGRMVPINFAKKR
jgi:hypothetical protein